MFISKFSAFFLCLFLSFSAYSSGVGPITIMAQSESGKAYEMDAWGTTNYLHLSGNRSLNIYDQDGRYLERNMTGNQCYFLREAICFEGNNTESVILFGDDYSKSIYSELKDIIQQLFGDQAQLKAYDSQANLYILTIDLIDSSLSDESLQAEVQNRR